ncbi:unnamed protein product [Ceutorhynchus assimilis]|uniref:Rho-GAP domain-containing protein n=1 Tax=Ceutorhynchus assimilis TaxID=467358 RepID=A0A9N9MVL0_9CUCU|nr:unnamed protein product [Ceutorhynchus assimilis]
MVIAKENITILRNLDFLEVSELPNPLCTYQLYQSFVNAVQGCGTAIKNTETDHERLLKMREAVQKLPPPHYRTLEYVMRHLARVSNHSGSTGMTTRNLAIVWAPNLLRCEALEVGGVAALQGVGVQIAQNKGQCSLNPIKILLIGLYTRKKIDKNTEIEFYSKIL